MRVVVTGATGFVGTWLVNELLEQGDEVVVIVRNKEKVLNYWGNKVFIVEAHLNQLEDLDENDFGENVADVFFHFAWDGTSGNRRSDTKLQLMNVSATCEAVKLAKRLGCKRFVNAGSIMEYEAIQNILAKEHFLGMGYIYSTAKMSADFMAKVLANNMNMEYVNVIISNIYGIGEKSERFLNSTIRKMMKHEPIPLTYGTQLYDFIYVSDAARGIVLAAKKGKSNVSYYIGNSIQYPLKDFILKMKNCLKSESELLFGAVPFYGARITYKEFDASRLETLGFCIQVPFEKGILLTSEWMKNEEF